VHQLPKEYRAPSLVQSVNTLAETEAMSETNVLLENIATRIEKKQRQMTAVPSKRRQEQPLHIVADRAATPEKVSYPWETRDESLSQQAKLRSKK
jgi:hypothetical protein